MDDHRSFRPRVPVAAALCDLQRWQANSTQAHASRKGGSAPVGSQVHLVHDVVQRDQLPHIEGDRVVEVLRRGVCAHSRWLSEAPFCS